MKILLVKTSSMGDVVHTLTAIREAKIQRPELEIDWLIEESFADIAKLAQVSGDIKNIIPIRFRQWRKQKPFGVFFNPEIRSLKRKLQNKNYDSVLDAQGLLKSVFLSRLASAPIKGFDRQSIREKLGALFYQHCYYVDKNQHAVERQRQLFSQAFDYELMNAPPNSSQRKQTHSSLEGKPSIILLHGTTWDNKQYSTEKWREVAIGLSKKGYRVLVPHHGQKELQVAQEITNNLQSVTLLPEQNITKLIPLLETAAAVISVDTGLAHLAVYLGTPTIMLFGPTRADLTGGLGNHTINLTGEANDTGSMKRRTYANTGEFSDSMNAIPSKDIISALQKVATSQMLP